MEPRATLAEYDAGRDEYTVYVANQNPHLSRYLSCRHTMDIPEHKLRFVAPDVGGGFGSKIFIYPEETVCVWACRKAGVPVKWTADRTEAFLTDAHGRDHITSASAQARG